ncbi:MAG: hypothetical protein KC925_01545 [Candidatus Doudnabacteria bacterium]|nr:hypothetical protein [Candidatus Doudnabacteria bacterium]
MPMTSVTGIVRQTTRILREDWRLVVWVWLVQLFTAFLLVATAAIAVTGGLYLLDWIHPAQTAVLTIAIGGTMMLWAIAFAFVSMLAITFFRAGLISTLRHRNRGDRTGIALFMRRARRDFRIVLRAHISAWTCTVGLVILLGTFSIALVWALGGLSGIASGDLVVYVRLALYGIPAVFAYWLAQITISFSAAFGAYEAYEDPRAYGWTPFVRGFRFLSKRMASVLGLNTIFFLIGIGAGYVLDIVSLPFNLIIEKILNESEVLVLGIALFIVSLIFWTAVQALIATWSEAGNYQLYSERH